MDYEINVDIENKKIRVWKDDTLIGFAKMRVVKEFPRRSKAPASKWLYKLPESEYDCRLQEQCLRTIFRCHNAAIALNERAGREVARIGRGEYPEVYVLRDSLK